MLALVVENTFQKDIKKLKKAGTYNFKEFDKVLDCLLNKKSLPAKYKNHKLLGYYNGYYDCHIKDNWVLLYKIDTKHNQLILARTGTHADVLGM
ncbi:MAG: type II toxin-antitoxin system YafQ family toxin [Candidatus Margulisbacteria bacterium]|nr:type II toxin-antitoxin system YafQ family toxin [Candidatus Margulisiibacteriota bacterium]